MEEEEISELDYFSQLRSKDTIVRLNAVKGVVKKLKIETKSNQRNAYLICKRLIRGLGGSNEVFRQGCFACITAFFSLFPEDFNISSLEPIIESELCPARNNSKQEKGEAYLGQILVYGAMVTSRIIFNQTVEVQQSVFQKIFQLGLKRSYLRHVSYVFLNKFFKSCNEFFPDGFLDDIKDLNSSSLDKLNYLLILEGKSIKTKTFKNVFGTKSFFDVTNATKIAGILKRNRAQILMGHTFIDEFIDEVLLHPDFFHVFWTAFTDPKNFTFESKETDGNIKYSNSNDDVILNLTSKLFRACLKSNNYISKSMLNRNLISLLIRNSKRDKKKVNSVLNDFCSSLKPANDEIKLSVLKQILFEYGILNFDLMTNSKTIITLTNSLSFNGISELANLYKTIIENKQKVVEFDLNTKSILNCLSYYTKLINSPICSAEISWRQSQLCYLLKLGYFKQSDIHLNKELINHIQEAFLVSLGHRFPNLDSFQKVLSGLIIDLNKLLIECRSNLLITFNDDMNKAWKNAFSVIEEMSNYIQNDCESKELVLILKIILQYMSLLLLKEPNTAIINIQDLGNIYLEIKEGSKTMWIEVLTDLFLNLLSKPNYHHRHLIRCTFKSLCQHLTLESFGQIVEVLELSYDPQNMLEANGEHQSDQSSAENDSDNEESENSEVELDEEISTNEKLRFELRNVLAAESDVESIDLDNMDEEEGKRLNETLGEIFKTNMKRRKNNFSKYQNQLAHFRTRVMDLVEICTEVPLPLSYWLKASLPLIDLFGSTIGQSKLDNLRSRISCCIKKLNSSKVIYESDCENDSVNVLSNLFQKVSKSSGIYSDMKSELVYMIRFILKSSKPFNKGLKQKHLDKNEIFQSFRKHLEEFFYGKNNSPGNLFMSVISVGWEGFLALFPNIVKMVFDESIKVHRRVLGIKMIERFIKTPQFFDGHLEKYYENYLINTSEIFHEFIIDAFQKLSSDKDVNVKFYSGLWCLLAEIINRQKKNMLPEMLNQGKLKELLIFKLQDLPSMKGQCKQQFRKFCISVDVNELNKIGGNISKNENNVEKKSKNFSKRKRKEKIYEGAKKKAKRLKINCAELTPE